MDGLFVLLILFGIISMASSGKKKKTAQRRNAQARGFRDAAENMQRRRETSDADWMQMLGRQISMESPEAAPVHLYTEQALVMPEAAAAGKAGKPAVQRNHSEGSFSTQGESAAEHAAHVRRIRAEEEARRIEHESFVQARSINLEKLRNAVVMSEVLGKPVSLRHRGKN